MGTTFFNSTNEIDLGPVMRSMKDIHTANMENNTSFDTEEETGTIKDFEVVRVEQGYSIDEDVEIIKISCCPRIRFVS